MRVVTLLQGESKKLCWGTSIPPAEQDFAQAQRLAGGAIRETGLPCMSRRARSQALS